MNSTPTLPWKPDHARPARRRHARHHHPIVHDGLGRGHVLPMRDLALPSRVAPSRRSVIVVSTSAAPLPSVGRWWAAYGGRGGRLPPASAHLLLWGGRRGGPVGQLLGWGVAGRPLGFRVVAVWKRKRWEGWG